MSDAMTETACFDCERPPTECAGCGGASAAGREATYYRAQLQRIADGRYATRERRIAREALEAWGYGEARGGEMASETGSKVEA
jgi:hypothetical protein